jgi:signal transduction histidine kinase/ActR/RegA family two-component response regulator
VSPGITKLPQKLSDEIFTNLFHVYSLFCCEVDQHGELIQQWGNNSFYGLSDWEIGKNVMQEDFLLGLPMDEEWVMRDVNVAPDNHADIYYTPNILGKRYLIFISTQASIERRRENQQRGNDLTLLFEQNKEQISKLQETQFALTTENISKSQFIAGMSHEFRTPLTSIMGYSQLISEQPGLSQQSQEHLNAVERASQHLLSLVENLLDQSLFDSEEFKLQLNNVSLEDLINEVAAVIAPLAGAKGLAFSASISTRCSRFAVMDNVRVRQILINLLGNAVKFTNDGEVSLDVDESKENFIFKVKDTGPGIPASEQEKIFNAFSRLKINATKPGVGLGLSISKQLIERMRGSIELESEDAKGSTFIVSLPYQRADEEYILQQTQPIPVNEEPETELSQSILLAEDNPDISNLLKLLLNRAGYEVTIAENGQLALAFARSREFDMIITDLQMPVLGGKALVKFLRHEGFTKPIIALTASHKKNERQTLLDSGFSAFLTKPIQMADLLSTLERLSIESPA